MFAGATVFISSNMGQYTISLSPPPAPNNVKNVSKKIFVPCYDGHKCCFVCASEKMCSSQKFLGRIATAF